MTDSTTLTTELQALVDDAVAQGARLLLGGKRLELAEHRVVDDQRRSHTKTLTGCAYMRQSSSARLARTSTAVSL